jgi:hypothetical protein
MDGFAVGLGLLIAGATVAFLTWPWWARRTDSPAGLETAPAQRALEETLDNRYEAVLIALRDLDFDHTMGKVTAEDYAPVRKALLVEAADIMGHQDERAVAEADPEARLEAEILTLRRTRRATSGQDMSASWSMGDNACPVCGRIPRPDDLYCASCGTKLNPACPQCGRTVDAADLFCAGCGAQLVPHPA